MERHARAHKKTWPEDQRRIDSHIKPALGTLPIGRVTRTEVEALHRRIGTDNGRYEANRTLALIKRIWNLGAAWDLVPASSNPASGVQTFRERKRDRYIFQEEAEKFLETVEEEDDWQVRGAVWLALLTGARRSEVLSRRWSDVDAVRRNLRVESGKGASLAREPSPPHYYKLSQLAVEILMDLPSASLDEAGHLEATNEWVFPSPRDSTSGHRESIKSAWTRIRKKSGLDGPGGIVFHDLRRTLGSDMANEGADLHLIGSVIGHRDPRTTQIYARLCDSVRHRAVDEFSQRILDRTGIDPVRNRDDAQSAQVLAVV
jgi:integrase